MQRLIRWPADATGYHLLLETAMDDDATDEAIEALANAGLLAGVDVTPPVVEFTGASLAADTTVLSDAADWVIHVTDRLGAIHSDPLDIGISRRDAKTTKKLAESEAVNAAHADSFTVAPLPPGMLLMSVLRV